jgi:hypothetical protein
MSNTIKQLFEEIPAFDQDNAAAILNANCEKIADELLTVSTTTLDEDEESLYSIANSDLLHTRDKEVAMAVDAYEEWKQEQNDKNWQSFKDIFNLAIRHVRINIAHWLESD